MTTVHASCVAVDGKGVLIRGPSGAGKSDLAMRLIDRGADLVSDDYTLIEETGGRLLASPPDTIRGKLEVRGLGVVDLPFRSTVPLHLLIDLVAPGEVERMPVRDSMTLDGISLIPLRWIALAPFEASAAAKVRLAVRTLDGASA
jgi:serine kinase of HPr protein (carbohydrate metabolism regulator)